MSRPDPPIDVEQEIAKLAHRQHGLLTAAQLTDLGLSRKVVARRVANGQWFKLHRGVLPVAGTPVTWESDVLARVLACGRGAVASHRTAAVLWGLDGARKGKPEITVPGKRCPSVDGARVHRSSDLDRARTVRRSGVPATSAERTVLDLGAVVSPERVQLAFDDALRRNLTTASGLLETLVTHARRGRGGVATLRAILDDHFEGVGLPDSGFERLVLTLLAQSDVPRPVLHHPVHVDGHTYEPDLAHPT